jgi:hypothetical protein
VAPLFDQFIGMMAREGRRTDENDDSVATMARGGRGAGA